MVAYYYKNPNTNEVFSLDKPMNCSGKPHILDDGIECEFIPWYLVDEAVKATNMGIIDKNAEVWEKDSAYVKKLAPKFVKRRDGVKEKYDPTRHR